MWHLFLQDILTQCSIFARIKTKQNMNKSKKSKQNIVINYTCKSAVNGIITGAFLIGYSKSKLVKLTIKLKFKGFSLKYYEKVLALLSKTNMEVVLKEDAHYLRLLSK